MILGLLDQQPMTGYDIKSLFKGLSWLIDTPSYGSLYPTLHTLLEEGLVSVSVEPSESKPPRKLYTITASGRQTLKAWIDTPPTPGPSVKEFARQLIWAGTLSLDERAAHLTRRRSQVMKYLSGSETGTGEPEDAREANLGWHLIHNYGAAIARAELAWLNTQLAELGATTDTTLPVHATE